METSKREGRGRETGEEASAGALARDSQDWAGRQRRKETEKRKRKGRTKKSIQKKEKKKLDQY